MSRFSSTESDGNSRRPSGTSAMPRATTACAGAWPIGWPSSRMASSRDLIAPAMHLSSVDFPAPLAPMTATTSPAATRSESPYNASSARTSRSASGIGRDPHVDFAHRWRIDDGLGIARADQAAAVEHDESIDDGNQRMHDVLDPDDRHAEAPDIPDQIDQRE